VTVTTVGDMFEVYEGDLLLVLILQPGFVM